MRTISRRPGVRVVRQDPIVYVNTATMIPDGMHGIDDGYHHEGWRTATMIPDGMHAYSVHDHTSFATEPVINKLIVNGIPPEKARSTVHAAAKMVRQSRSGLGADQVIDKTAVMDSVFQELLAKGVPSERARILVYRASARYHRLSGLGDGATVDAAVLSKAQDTQSQHRALLDAYGTASSDADRQDIRNQLDALYNDWTQYAVGVEGGAAPYQWDNTDPTAAVLIAVRNDIANTNALIDAGKAQTALQKQIVVSSQAQGPSALPPLPKLSDVPWYVWAGGAGAGLLALKHMLK
jgi:hypothetical protein